MPETSTKPYLLRAIYEWCTDNGYTPYLAVFVDARAQVPMDYVKHDEIVLNISFDATSQLHLGNDLIEFQARFGGVSRKIEVPVDNVLAIYARENGQGMAFPVDRKALAAPETAVETVPKLAPVSTAGEEDEVQDVVKDGESITVEQDSRPDPPKTGNRPSLKVVK